MTTQPGMTKGGVEILIRTELEQYISNIQRVDHRIMTITLRDQPKDIPIMIVASYGPHRIQQKKNTGETTRNNRPDPQKAHGYLVC